MQLRTFSYVFCCSVLLHNVQTTSHLRPSNQQNTPSQYQYGSQINFDQFSQDVHREYIISQKQFGLNQSRVNQRYFEIELFRSASLTSYGNSIMSPFSILQMLAMVAEAAEGISRQQLLHVLQDTYVSGNNLRRNVLDLRQKLEQSRGYDIIVKIANHLVMSSKNQPSVQFQNILKTFYLSGLDAIDFNDRIRTAYMINQWVKRVTDGFITNIIRPDNIPVDTSVILLNALYFKGSWSKSFNQARTEPRCFNYASNDCQTHVWMMDASGVYNFANVAALDAKILEIPYKDEKYSMVIFLPNKNDGLGSMMQGLSREYGDAIGRLRKQEIFAGIPRFSFEYSKDIQPDLKEMGITHIFNYQTANLTRMTGRKTPLHVGSVIHKAKIDVNEEGSEAGAITQSNVISLMGGNSKPRFIADHPFVFIIRHIETNTILFIGKVVEPTKATIKKPENKYNQIANGKNKPSGLPHHNPIRQQAPNINLETLRPQTNGVSNIPSAPARPYVPIPYEPLPQPSPLVQTDDSQIYFPDNDLFARRVRNKQTSIAEIQEQTVRPKPNVDRHVQRLSLTQSQHNRS